MPRYVVRAFGGTLELRPINGKAALFANGTGTAQYDHLRVVQYPDPSASMALAGRATDSVVNWNANTPSGTGLTTYTSLDDGATYQLATSANDIAGISTQLHSTLVQQYKPAGYFRLDEVSGINAIDASGNGNGGTYSNDGHGNLVGVTLGATGALQGPGETTDTAVTLNGTTGYVTLSTPLNGNGAAALSFSGWFNLSTTSLGAFTQLIQSDNTGGANKGFQLYWNGTANLNWQVGNGTTNASAIFNASPVANAWWHVVGVYDGAHVKLYVNGVLRDTASLTGTISATATPVIGATTGHGSPFPGSIDEVAIFPNVILAASDVAALYNAGLAGIGQVANDSFTADTHTSYTQTFGTGGSATTWTWDTANSRLIASGGSKGHLIYNGLYAYDTDILADFYQAENSGLIWGYQDASNYYSLVLKDSNAVSGANTATLNKIVNNVSTQLATTAITWQVVTGGITYAQVHHRFHMTMLSGVITVSMDENQILTYTDSSPFPAGLAGLRNDTGTSYIYLLAITPQPVDLSSKFIVSKHVLTTTSPTVTPQLTDHQAFSGDSTFGVGALVPSADYRQTYVSDNVDDLNTKSNYWWQFGTNKNVVFQPRNAKNSPWILQSTDILTNTLPTVEYSGDLYRNRQTLKGVYDTSTFDEVRNGDGQTRTWNLSNPVVGVPIIALNGIVASVGIQGTDTGKQFYYTPNDVAITQDNSQTILQKTDVLEITYTGSFGIDFSLDNTGQFTNTVSQSQLAAMDNTDGIIEAVEDVSSQNMNVAAATAYANSLLQRYGSIARTIKFDTLHGGLKPGHSLPVFIPQLNIFDSVFLIIEVNTSVRTIAGGNVQYVYSCVASENASLSSWQKLFSRVMRSVSGTKAKV